MNEVHSEFGASSAERFINCTGSVALINLVKSLYGEPESSVYASEGTAAHTLAAWCLDPPVDNMDEEPRREPWEYIGEAIEADGHSFKVDADMASAVGVFVNLVRGDLAGYMDLMHWDYSLYVEHKFHHPQVHTRFFGTTDAALVLPEWRQLRIYDYKHGAGVAVSPVENDQLLYYAVGVMCELSSNVQAAIDEVVLHIVQPRAGGDVVQVWSTTPQYLREWLKDRLLPAIYRAEAAVKAGGGELNPGPWCRFCPAKQANACEALNTDAKSALRTAETVDVKAMTDTELAYWQARRETVKMFLTEVERETYKRLSNGVAVPGWKLVKKRANRVWLPEAEAALRKEYGDGVYERKLKSPAQVENLPGGSALTEKYAEKPDAGLTVAPENSKSEEAQPRTATDAFANIPARD